MIRTPQRRSDAVEGMPTMLERMSSLQDHIADVSSARTRADVVTAVDHAAREVAGATCARLIGPGLPDQRGCELASCPVCGLGGEVRAGWNGPGIHVTRWPLRSGGELLARTPDEPDELTARMLAWIAGQADVALDRVRREEDAAATIESLLRTERKRGELVEMLAHDLRSPMTALHGFASLLAHRWGELDETRRSSMLGMIQRETNRLNRLVEDVSTAVLGDRGSLPIDPTTIDLGPLLADLADATRAAAPEHNIRLTGGADVPPVLADADRLAQIIRNLLANAVRHTPAGTVVVVHAEAGREGGVEISVTDDADLIAEHEREHIFERGQRGERALAGTGFGIGLAAARDLAHAMGGDLWLEGDSFTRFVVRVPASRTIDADGLRQEA